MRFASSPHAWPHARVLHFLKAQVATADRRALWFLILLPIAIYLPLSLAGHPVMPGDNLTQNLPLRTLSGDLIRNGQLPGWNSLIWSGTPLLAGWNAGALFPGTLLFAILPAIAAWTVNIVAVPILSATGMYLFSRKIKCGPVAATFGALVFTYTGFMSGQVVHIGLVQGTSLLPWILLSLEGIFHSKRRGYLPGYVAILGVAFGSTVLAGDPRAATTAVVAFVLYLFACIWRVGRHSFVALYASALGVVIGVFFSAIQWLPGLGFLHNSQRGQTIYSFFGSGSLTVSHALVFMLMPFIFGGNGNFGLPIYSGSYNLPEVTIGCGLLVLIALGAYLPEFAHQWHQFLRRLLRKSATLPRRSFGVWFVFIVVGGLLTLGTNTPLGHLLVHIPLYGHERLQNRNAVLVDLALAVLGTYFIDDLIARRQTDHVSKKVARKQRDVVPLALETATSKVFALIPVVALLGLVGYAYARPIKLQTQLHIYQPAQNLYDRLTPYLIPTIVLGVGTLVFVVLHQRLSHTVRNVLLAGLAIVDIGIFIANASYAGAPSNALAATSPFSKQVATLDGPNGRFALYNPSFYGSPYVQRSSIMTGVSDINILQNNPSVQGYGSIVQGTYQDATQTHGYESIALGRLNSETFNTLDLKTFLTLPYYFGQTIGDSAAVPIPKTSSAPHNATGPWKYVASQQRYWELPGAYTLTRAAITLNAKTLQEASLYRVGFISKSGATTYVVPTAIGNTIFATAPTNGFYTSITLVAPASLSGTALVEAVVAVTKHPATRLVLNGPLQGKITPPHWQYVTNVGPYLAFQNSETLGLSWLQAITAKTPNTGQATTGSVQVLSSADASIQTMRVSTTTSATLVRSETFAPGWTARITPVNGGPTIIKTARRFGLVQAVDLTPGDYVVTWRYAPREILVGLILGIIAVLAIIFLCAVVIQRRRRLRINRDVEPDVHESL